MVMERPEDSEGPKDPLGGGWVHRSKRLPQKPPNWESLSPEARKKWEDFVSWYLDQLEDEQRDKWRKHHGY